MQFKHPEILYALLLLIIPIIVHLFQLRRFQKTPFTNVAFLKQVVIQTRKSSQLKKWLTLLTRMLLLACLVVAFAQPFIANSDMFSVTPETVIYLDNSFSMQAKGEQGELLKRAVQDIIDQVNPDEKISVLTNDALFKSTTIKTIQNDLLQLGYSSNQLSYDAAFLKSKNLFHEDSSLKNLIFISDFQQKEAPFIVEKDSTYRINLVKLNPVNLSNISIDSAYIDKPTASLTQLKVNLRNNGNPVNNVSISLYDGNKLLAKTATNLNDKTTVDFSITDQEISNGKVVIDDTSLQFDNQLFFNVNKPSKMQVLVIGDSNSTYLEKLFSSNEFEYAHTPLAQLNYSIIDSQNVIVLNELVRIPNALVSTLKAFMDEGGYVINIPAESIDFDSYNQFLAPYSIRLNPKIEAEKRVTQIQYAHPIYANVFDRQVTNFQYPKVSTFYPVSAISSLELLQYEDSKPFLIQSSQLFVFTASLNTNNSSFTNSPLIVPTFYNIAKQSLKLPELYYTIGVENVFDISASMQQDAILTIQNNQESIIPRQQYFNNKVTITTNESPSIASNYDIVNNNEVLSKISFNYHREESIMVYQNLEGLENITLNDSVADMIKTLKSNTKVNELWKWFIIFALAFLILEMLILKYFK